MSDQGAIGAFSLLAPPYRTLKPLENEVEMWKLGRSLRGTALVWSVAKGKPTLDVAAAAGRLSGVSLIVILPPADILKQHLSLLDLLDSCRPQTVLPYHASPDPEELARLLARPPQNAASEIVDYLSWRGLHLSPDTRHLVRRTLELSGDTRTIASLARSLFISRRALGRRFLVDGLPVPSHWLQFGRLFRVVGQLQNSTDSLFTIATRNGYADGFAMSNQMHRLTGVRPSTARDALGWEWFVEAWLDTEVAEGGFILPPTIPHSLLTRTQSHKGDPAKSHGQNTMVAESRPQ